MAGCYICMDLGFINYFRKIGKYEYEYMSHCTCQKGDKYHYDGMAIQKHKAPYYVPCVSQVLDINGLIESNKRKEREAKERRIENYE